MSMGGTMCAENMTACLRSAEENIEKKDSRPQP